MLPEPFGQGQWINFDTLPPCDLCTMPVQLTVMDPAQRDSELIADFAAERARLSKTQMMRVRWRAPAYQARLAGYVSAMVLVAEANGLDRDSATAGLGFFGTNRGFWGIRRSGGLCLYQAWSSFWELRDWLVAHGRHLGPEGRFDNLGVRGRQAVLGFNPSSRIGEF